MISHELNFIVKPASIEVTYDGDMLLEGMKFIFYGS